MVLVGINKHASEARLPIPGQVEGFGNTGTGGNLDCVDIEPKLSSCRGG